MLRKTHSQPQSTKAAVTLLLLTPSGESRLDTDEPQKHSRCQSVPSPLHGSLSEPLSVKGRKSTLPSVLTSEPIGSPVAITTTPVYGDQDVSAQSPEPASTSPKPKRNFLEGVKHSLRPKSKEGGARAKTRTGHTDDVTSHTVLSTAPGTPLGDNYATVSQITQSVASSKHAGDKNMRHDDCTGRSPSDKACSLATRSVSLIWAALVNIAVYL